MGYDAAMIASGLGILALLLLTVGLLAGTAGSGRAMAQAHHQHHQGTAAPAAEPCATDGVFPTA